MPPPATSPSAATPSSTACSRPRSRATCCPRGRLPAATSRSPTRRSAAPRGRPLVASPQVLDRGNRRASMDDHPAPRHRRGPRQLGRPHRHDHPRRASSTGRDAPPRSGSRGTSSTFASASGLPVFHEPINGLYSYVRAQPDLFAARARPRRERAQAGGVAAARRARRLLRTREPARLRRSRRRARRRHDPREGTAARLGDPAGLGRAEAEDRRLSRAARTTSAAGRRSRTCGRARTRTTTRAWRANGAS